MEAFFNGIANTTVVFSVVFAIFSILVYNKTNKVFHLFLVYIIMGGSFDLVSTFFFEKKMNNLKFFHLYTLLEFVILSVFIRNFLEVMKPKFDLQKAYLPAVVFIIINSLFIQGLDIYNSYSAALSSILILGYCIYTFYLLLDFQMSKIYISFKWIVIGVFINHIVTLIVMLSSNVVLNISSDYRIIIWIIKTIVGLFTKLLFFIIIVKSLNHPKKHSLNGR